MFSVVPKGHANDAPTCNLGANGTSHNHTKCLSCFYVNCVVAPKLHIMETPGTVVKFGYDRYRLYPYVTMH